ncbi:hypothetical protein HGRIS_002538 [Hohenbuehelia grisea]|uniref:BAG domain-containing protein n=1 Tax=Hohenbuehelia grisea TaxID=104357 RepID=A0ABR3JLH2_9AGAR
MSYMYGMNSLRGLSSYHHPLPNQERYLAAAAELKAAEAQLLAEQVATQRERDAALYRRELEESLLYSQDRFSTVTPEPRHPYSRRPLAVLPPSRLPDLGFGHLDQSYASPPLDLARHLELLAAVQAQAQAQQEQEALEHERRQIEQLKALRQQQAELARAKRQQQLQEQRRHEQELAAFANALRASEATSRVGPNVSYSCLIIIILPCLTYILQLLSNQRKSQPADLVQLLRLAAGGPVSAERENARQPSCARSNSSGIASMARPSGAPAAQRKILLDPHALQALLGGSNASIRQPASAPAEQTLNSLFKDLIPSRSKQVCHAQPCHPSAAATFQSLFEQLSSGQASAPEKSNEPESNGEVDVADIFKLLSSASPDAAPPAKAKEPEAHTEVVDLADLFKIFSSVHTASPANLRESAREPKVEPSASTSVPPQKAKAAPVPAAVPETLKEQLETRLNSEFAVEVRDTIHALLASLSDVNERSPASSSQPASSSASSSKPAQAAKGKAKAADTEYGVKVPTSADVLHSYNTVENIEAAFASVSADFVFPVQLDFTPPSSPSSTKSIPLPGSDAASFTSSADSVTRHLAYTARNQPLRFYEQALSALLGQLDEVQSFGNDALRSRRKEVVSKVEHALEELEREVEGRWISRQRKDAKPEKASQATETATPASTETLQGADLILVPTEATASAAPSVEPAADSASDEETERPSALEETANLKNLEDSVVPSDAKSLPFTIDTADESIDVSDNEEIVIPDNELHVEPSLSDSLPDMEAHDDDKLEAAPSDISFPPSAPSSYPPSSSASVATIRPKSSLNTSLEPAEPIDTFLIPATTEPESLSRVPLNTARSDDADVGSDWSELDDGVDVHSA